jgi:catechol 2,3-dioxygenase-like lactoylglutathione lyase family enzyme
MATQTETRPPVAIGDITLRVTVVAQATEYFVTLGLRLIHQSETFTVPEL